MNWLSDFHLFALSLASISFEKWNENLRQGRTKNISLNHINV